MRLTLALCLHFLTLLLNPFVQAAEWSYEDQEFWSHQFHECNGLKQSPINIDTDATRINQSLRLTFARYEQPMINYKAENNGHSIQFTYIGDRSSEPTISGSALGNENYALTQFHFHWGLHKGIGSEHTVNGRQYSAEMHLVHFNAHKYESLSAALAANEGVTVIGVFFEIERKDNPAFAEIARIAGQLSASNQTLPVTDPIRLEHMLPGNSDRFYRYDGSLTTPPCTEGVTWIVMNDPVQMGYNQFEQFKKIVNSKTRELVGNNYRNLQSTRGRTVEASFDAHKDGATSHPLSGGLIGLCLATLLLAKWH